MVNGKRRDAFFINLLKWTESNDMQLNASKTKQMILGPLAKFNPPLLSTTVGTIDRVILPSNYLAFILTPHFLGLPTLTISSKSYFQALFP